MKPGLFIALRVAAPPERAFDAFTRDIGLWWQPNALFQFVPGKPGGAGRLAFETGVGGRFTETFADGSVFEIGRITAWEPPARLAFTWRQASFAPDQLTHVEVRFEPLSDGTRVSVRHEGWETIPQAHAARHTFPDAIFLARHGQWWQTLLASLRARLSEHARQSG